MPQRGLKHKPFFGLEGGWEGGAYLRVQLRWF